MLGYCTLGMKGIAEEPWSTRSVQGASVSNKDTLLARVWEPPVLRRREGEEGKRPTFHWPHGWSPGLAAVTLSLCKKKKQNLLPKAGMESVGSTLPDPKGICYYYINPETKEGMKVARMDPKDHNPHLVGKF